MALLWSVHVLAGQAGCVVQRPTNGWWLIRCHRGPTSGTNDGTSSARPTGTSPRQLVTRRTSARTGYATVCAVYATGRLRPSILDPRYGAPTHARSDRHRLRRHHHGPPGPRRRRSHGCRSRHPTRRPGRDHPQRGGQVPHGDQPAPRRPGRHLGHVLGSVVRHPVLRPDLRHGAGRRVRSLRRQARKDDDRQAASRIRCAPRSSPAPRPCS